MNKEIKRIVIWYTYFCREYDMKKLFGERYRDIIICIVCFFIVMIFSLFINQVTFDEVWNYGFSYNISKGMIPYKDFSMVLTPFSMLMGSIFINIFGKHLISVCILNSLIVTGSFFLIYKILGRKGFILFPLFLLYTSYGYNSFCLLFLIILLYFIDKDIDDYMWMGFIIGLCFITKQTVGLCLFIPFIWYSKDKRKCIFSFLVPILILAVYLVCYQSMGQFIDYCFLGLLEFGSNNTNVTWIFLLEVIICIVLLVLLIKSKFKDKILFYILVFQIMAFPLGDLYHLMISIIPVMFYVLYRVNIKFVMIFMGVFFFNILIVSIVRNVSKINIVMDNNYLFLRNMYKESYNNLVNKSKVVDESANRLLEDYYFVISPDSYFTKLYLDIDANKFDLILRGNMGYNGGNRYKRDIKRICKNKKCLFYLGKGIIYDKSNQFDKSVYDFIIKNNKLVKEDGYYYIYANYDVKF